MPVSPTARARARADAAAATAEQKRTYAERIRRLQAAARPPLSNAELSLGLELGELEVGRFVSESPRMATARPDREVRALIDAVLGGALVCAVHVGVPGARRDVVIIDPTEARRLDRSWTLLDLGGAPVLRVDDLDDDDVWNLGVARPAPVRGPVEPRELLGRRVFPLVFGTLRLGTAGRPEPDAARAVLHAALDAGVEVVDTADSYGLDEADRGYAERLIASVARKVLVVTKAGLARPGGRWVPDGSPARLRSGAEQSLRALGTERLDLMLLHVVDPKVPLADSVGELVRLRDEGKIGAIGLSNVTVAELDAALALTPIAAVQVELSRFDTKAWPVVVRCHDLGIPVLAHRPLGGHARRGKADAAAGEVSERFGAGAARVSLAWLLSLAPHVLPVFGATTPEHVRDSAAAATVRLDEPALQALDRGMPTRLTGDAVVLLCGPPAAGKTSRVQAWVDRGFGRLNRDELGGTLDGLVKRLRGELAEGKRRWVLDNTYPTRASRRPVIEAARAAGVPARCVLVDTPEPEATYNAALRWLQRYGRLPEPGESKEANDIPPAALHHYFQTFEAPSLAEGLATVERVPFLRAPTGTRRAVLLDVDGTLRRTPSGAPYPRSVDEVELLPGRREKLRALRDEGWLLLGVSNQSGIARGDVDRAAVEACFVRTAELLGVDLPVRYCPHAAGALRCWCRKPMPGLGVSWILDHDLDRAACVMVGDLDSDRGFAENLGVRFVHADTFFG